MDEAELVRRCVEREPGAWEELVRRCGPVVRGFLERAVRKFHPFPEERIDDLQSGFFLKLLSDDFRLLRKWKPDASLEAWLKTVALGHLRDVRKSEYRRNEHLHRYAEEKLAREFPEPAAGAAQRDVRLEEGLNSLSDRDRLLLQLHVIDELPYDRIGPLLGLSPESVGPALSRAKQKLREILSRNQ